MKKQMKNFFTLFITYIFFFTAFAGPIATLASGSGSGTGRPSGAELDQAAMDQMDADIKKQQEEGAGEISEEEAQKMKDDAKNGKVAEVNSEGSSGENLNDGATMAQVFYFIFAVAAAVNGVTWVVMCSNNISGWIFALAAIAYLIFEIYQWATLKHASERNLKAVTNVESETVNIQVEAIDAAKQETQDAADYTSRRATWMFIIGALWIVAGIFGFLEFIWRIGSWGSYQDACIGIGASVEEEHADLIAMLEMTGLDRKQILALLGPSEKEEIDTHFLNKEYIDYFDGKVSSPSVKSYYLMAKTESMGPYNQTPEFSLNSLVDVLKDGLIIRDARADDSDKALSSIGMVGAVLTAVISMIIMLKAANLGGRANGIVRGITFICYAVFIMIAGGYTQDKASQLQKRVGEYDALKGMLLEKMNVDKPDLTDAPGYTSSGGNTSVPTDDTNYDEGVSGAPGSCATNGGNNGNPNAITADANCGCKATNTCINVKSANIPEQFGGVQTPNALLSSGKDASGLVNNLAKNEKATSGALKYADAGQRARLNKLKDQVAKKVDDLLKKQNPKNKNVQGLMDEFNNKLKSKFQTYVDGLSPSGRSDLLNGLNVSSPASDKLQKSDKLGKNLKDKLAAISPIMVAPKTMPVQKISFGDDDEAPAVAPVDESLSTENASENYEVNASDIVKNDGVSLFQVISTRYQKSAFPIFFVKKKELSAKENKPEVKK